MVESSRIHRAQIRFLRTFVFFQKKKAEEDTATYADQTMKLQRRSIFLHPLLKHTVILERFELGWRHSTCDERLCSR